MVEPPGTFPAANKLHEGPTCVSLMLSVLLHLQFFPRPLQSVRQFH